ncbi:hypothetical protein MICA_1950 [Micavibrio aeruginosavorus ARL-13]|uniref:Uncharacterized protein n=1 Tax=Micavibrio aeruginosavorus (strain ARL-13) TaxID=856793 RepID=G2KNL4_MICAA|nr:hypothetical protein MICA_1950 [Micavibrio aeruginosavorus ARL-13]
MVFPPSRCSIDQCVKIQRYLNNIPKIIQLQQKTVQSSISFEFSSW